MPVLLYGVGRETPVGPPWITTISGYFLPASKPIGFCSTPSMRAPSLLVQETTSIGALAHVAAWAPKSVSLAGRMVASGAVYSSGKLVASLATNAAVEASALRENPLPIQA